MSEIERRDRGFTLIEIVFVLAIIIVLASLIMPWGPAYVAHVGAMEKNGVPVAIASLVPFLKPQGWILSAGPDGIFQTSPTDTVLAGDDIGFILFTKKPG